MNKTHVLVSFVLNHKNRRIHPMNGVTTALPTRFDKQEFCTATERYPIMGDLLSLDIINSLLGKFKGLHKYYDCHEKARIVYDYVWGLFSDISLVYGAFYIDSATNKSQYGFLYNPPFEFHAWIDVSGGIIDLSLPGVIENGSKSCDQYGAFLEGREPVVLSGYDIPEWLHYEPKSVTIGSLTSQRI